MAKISREEVLKIARLARLELSEDEVVRLQSDMAKILEYMEILNEADVKNIPPTFYTLQKQTPLREDRPERTFTAEEMLRNAPEKKEGFFVVPRVIE